VFYYLVHDTDNRCPSGPASIVYNEGGQRAEEDDLDEDDPVHPSSSYVSRGPSPPLAGSHLPVPEKPYLEVPNATSSIHTSKSRGSPPELGVDKGKRREDAPGNAPSRSVSTSRNVPTGVELPGPIALTDSNSSRRSGAGRLGETLTSVWGNIPPSGGPSANSSLIPSPLEGPTSRSAILNALQPLASVPEGSAIPEVIHANTVETSGSVPEVYRSSPPKTPKAETPRASASSVAAKSLKGTGTGTPKATSKIPTAAPSARPGGTPRGMSIYSSGPQPPAVATPRGSTFGAASPTHASPPVAPPEPSTGLVESGREAHAEPPAVATPKPASRVPTKPPTRLASPSPQPAELPAPSAEMEPPVVEATPLAPVTEAPPPAPVETPATEPAQAETAATEEDWFQPKSKAASRKGSKATSKAGSKAASKVPTPKGTETPNPENANAGAFGEGSASATGGTRPPSGVPSPLPTVHEDAATGASAPEAPPAVEVAPEGGTNPPGSFFVTNPDDTPAAPEPAEQSESATFPSFGNSLSGSVGGVFGVASSALGWGSGFGKKEEKKSKPSTPKTTGLGWGGFGSAAPSVAGSAGGLGWGSATGNNSSSNTAWMGGLGTKSGNASTADLLGGDMNVDHPTENGESHVQNTAPPAGSFEDFVTVPTDVRQATDEAAAAESQEHAEFSTREHLTVKTDVPAAATEANTAGPGTTGGSPEGGADGADGEDGGVGGEKAAAEGEDFWGVPVKQKKKKGGSGANTNTNTPATPNTAGGGDDVWATASKKKGGGGKGKKK
jgi:hypothetical protein